MGMHFKVNCQLYFKLTDRERSDQEGSRSSSLNLFHDPMEGTLAELRGSLGLGSIAQWHGPLGACAHQHIGEGCACPSAHSELLVQVR